VTDEGRDDRGASFSRFVEDLSDLSDAPPSIRLVASLRTSSLCSRSLEEGHSEHHNLPCEPLHTTLHCAAGGGGLTRNEEDSPYDSSPCASLFELRLPPPLLRSVDARSSPRLLSDEGSVLRAPSFSNESCVAGGCPPLSRDQLEALMVRYFSVPSSCCVLGR
jgi:hypothetical protein